MKSKKLISFLCAAAMTASTFASLAVTASAATEADILWSDTFNNAAAGVIADGTTSQQTVADYVKGLTFVTVNRGSGDKASYTDSNGNYVLSGSYYAVMGDKADTADKYLRMSFPHFGDFGSNGRWAHVDLGSGYAATADKDVVMDFDLKITDGLNKGEKSEKTPTLRIGSFDATAKTATAVEIDKAKYSIGDDWVDARIIVSNSTGAKLYIDGTEVAGAANANVKTLDTIGLYSTDPTQCGDGAMADLVGNSQYDDGTLNDATKPTKSAIADIDNVIIYNEAAGVATGTSAAPGAKDQEGGATPKPVATETPIGTAPTLAISTEKFIDKNSIEVYNFDDLKPVKWSLGTADQDVAAIDGLNIHIGSREKGGSVSTFASIAKGDSDNVLQMQAGQYAHAGRAPRLNVKTSMAEAFAAGKTLAMSFAVKLSVPLEYKDNADAKPRLYFMKNADQAGDDGTGAYNKVAAVLTTVEGEEIKRGDTDVISAYITPDEWHYVTFVVSPRDGGATHRLYVDGGAEPAVKCDYVATGDAATYMDNLPMITVQSRAAKISGADVNPEYGLANIDNLMVYNGEPSEPKRMCATPGDAPVVSKAPATPEPIAVVNMAVTEDGETATVKMTSDIDTKADLIKASYDEGGKLVKLDIKNVTLSAGTELTETVANTVKGDKIMLWNSVAKMAPLAASYTITQGAAQATKAPEITPTPEVTEAPSEAPTEAPSTEPSTAPSTAPSTEPSTAPSTAPSTEPSTEPTAAPTPAPTVPVLAGTTLDSNDFSTEGDIWGWIAGRSSGSFGPSVKNANGVLSILNNVNAGGSNEIDYKIFEKAISDSTSVEMMFDYLPQIDEAQGRSSSLVLSDGTDKTTVGNPILTLIATGNAGVTYAVGAGEAVKIADKGGASTKLRVYVKLAEGKADVLIFDITGDTPKCVADVSEAAVAATCLKRMAVTMINSLAPVAIDNVQINTTDTGLVPVTVTAPNAADGTLAADAKLARVNDVITITPAAVAGKKITAVKVNGTAIQTTTVGEGDTAKQVYQYTVTAEDTAVAITAEFARADVTAVNITSTNANVQKGQTGTYTAAVMAGTTELTGQTIAWNVAVPTADDLAEGETAAASVATGTTIANGTLTVADDQAEGILLVTASVKKDAAADDSAENVTVGTFKVTIVGEPVYQVAKAEGITNGDVEFKVGENTAVAVKQSETLTIVPKPAAGYEVTSVSYAYATGNPVTVEKTGDAYTVAGSALTGNITVTVTYTAINYTITNNSSEAVNESKLEVDKTSAIIGDTVTITPTIKDGALMILSVKNGEADVATTKTDDGKYTFTMPAGNVVVSAQFVMTKDVELTSDQVTQTYVDMTDANADTSYIGATTLNIGYMNVSGGKLVARNKAYADQASAAIISVDASEHLGKIYGAKISFDMTAGGNNTWINVVGEYANYIDMKAENASVTGNNINDLGGTPINTYSFAAWTYGSTENQTVSHTIPIDNIFTKDADGKVTMYIYTGTGRLNTISNVKVTLTVADETVTE